MSSSSTQHDNGARHVTATANRRPAHGLMLGAIGVVFGDIGTSPLYTLKEAFSPHFGLIGNHDTVLGILSLVFWALMIVVTLKYVTIIMRADNEGEGGIMALMALAQRTLQQRLALGLRGGHPGHLRRVAVLRRRRDHPGHLGAGRGRRPGSRRAAACMRWIVPITVVVLIAVFAAQRFGTEKVGKVFGPITSVWFISLAAIGIRNIVDAPEVLKAFNPWWALRFFMAHGWHALFILGAVVLAVTGGEALYADMGHFGPKPIRHAWYFFVLPCLVLNYLGQGALVLEHPSRR